MLPNLAGVIFFLFCVVLFIPLIISGVIVKYVLNKEKYVSGWTQLRQFIGIFFVLVLLFALLMYSSFPGH